MFVAARDELEEQVRGVLIKWNVADFIDDQDAVAPQLRELSGELASRVRVLQPGDGKAFGRSDAVIAFALPRMN